MPTARRHVTVTAPPHRWKLLGELLSDRRTDLGYTYRVPFDKVSNVNQRMQADIEKAAKARVNHFTDKSLRKIARGYQVTWKSMLAVLRGDADQLEPAPPPAVLHLPAPDADPPGWAKDRIASDRPWFNEINERRVELASPPRGIAYPTGAQMFGEGTEDAQVWDGPGARLPVGDRVWLVADMRRRAAARTAGQDANSHSA